MRTDLNPRPVCGVFFLMGSLQNAAQGRAGYLTCLFDECFHFKEKFLSIAGVNGQEGIPHFFVNC